MNMPTGAIRTTGESVESLVSDHLGSWPGHEEGLALRDRYWRDGFIKVPEIVPGNAHDAIRQEVHRLLDENAERRDLYLHTTGGTPRRMSVVRSQAIAKGSGPITALYHSRALRACLSAIAGEEIYSCPSEDEEFLITRQERMGDTHGWHWGDFSFALIWIIDTPPIEVGGMLQCVPHTRWDKENPRIHQYLCANPIATYGFVPGDIYFLRTDTTLHRTVPLTADATRIILNMTWAAAKDLHGAPAGDDRWWEHAEVGRQPAESGPEPADG